MNDELNHEVVSKTASLVFRASSLTKDTLVKAMRAYLQREKNKVVEPTHGKITMEELVGQNAGANYIEVNSGNIKSFEKTAKKYNVDFAVKKDIEDPSKYLVFFKGRDLDVINQAFLEFVKKNERKHDKDNDKENERPSLKEKLVAFKKEVEKRKHRERVKEKEKDRGLSL